MFLPRFVYKNSKKIKKDDFFGIKKIKYQYFSHSTDLLDRILKLYTENNSLVYDEFLENE